MVIKALEQKKLQGIYEQEGNQIVVLYGRTDSGKEQVVSDFISDKKFFYYRARETSARHQCEMMGKEISRKFDVRLQKYTYDEYFNRIKSGDPTKFVLVIDEFQLLVKKDPAFLESIKKLKAKRLYPGPVMIVLCSSSIAWTEQDFQGGELSAGIKINAYIKMEELHFVEVVHAFPNFQVRDCVQIYGIIGGVVDYINRWNPRRSLKENVCKLILTNGGYLFHGAEALISSELREPAVYNAILAAIAAGYNKLNDLYLVTGFSRAKISVYMKNLSYFDIIEKVVSFETGGWENAKKGMYQIKDTFVNFWYRFVFPHLSDLYLLNSEKFYERYIEPDLDSYLSRYFRNVCMEYLLLLNQMNKLPFVLTKMGTWIGKTGNIDIIAHNTARENLVGMCNWDKPAFTLDMCKELFASMEKAKITSKHCYLFSAKAFAPELIKAAEEDDRLELIDMNEL